MDYDAIERERKLERKMMNTGIVATFSGGIGLAIFIMQSIFGGMAPAQNMNALINDTCLILMAYTGLIFATYLFRRQILLKVNFFMLYIVLPAAFLKLVTSYM